MSQPVSFPPPLPRWHWRGLVAGELDHETLWLSVSAAVALTGGLWLRSGLPLPPCLLKAATGCPCPTCGATRAALRLLQGDLHGAFLYNPLVFVAGASVLVYDGYAAAVLGLRLPRLRLAALTPAAGFRLRVAAGAAVAANWAWVIWRGN